MNKTQLLIKLDQLKDRVNKMILMIDRKEEPNSRNNNALAVSKARSRAIKDTCTGIAYDSIEKTAKDTGVSRQTIINHCKKRVKWVRFEYVN